MALALVLRAKVNYARNQKTLWWVKANSPEMIMMQISKKVTRPRHFLLTLEKALNAHVPIFLRCLSVG